MRTIAKKNNSLGVRSFGTVCRTPDEFACSRKSLLLLTFPCESHSIRHLFAECCTNGYAGCTSRACESLEWLTMVTQSSEPLALRPVEAAKALGISARTLWGLTAPRGPVPCLRIGHGKRQTVLYPVSDLQAWLRQQAEATQLGQSIAGRETVQCSDNSQRSAGSDPTNVAHRPGEVLADGREAR